MERRPYQAFESKLQKGQPRKKRDEADEWQAKTVSQNTLIPLADAIERFIKLPPGGLSDLIMQRMLKCEKEVARRYLAWKKSPEYANDEFVKTIDETVATFRRLRFPKSPFDFEWETFRQSKEYQEAINKALSAADYLRQTASMLAAEESDIQSSKSEPNRPLKTLKPLHQAVAKGIKDELEGERLWNFVDVQVRDPKKSPPIIPLPGWPDLPEKSYLKAYNAKNPQSRREWRRRLNTLATRVRSHLVTRKTKI